MTTREMIEKAFADVSCPGDDNIADHQDCPECDEMRAFFRGKSWRDLKFPELHDFHSSLPLLTDDAFLYFLPGYMLASLDNWSQIENIPFSIIQIGGYSDDAPAVKDECRENRKVFTTAQRAAIAAWLKDLHEFDSTYWRDDDEFAYNIEKLLQD
jgi:hypothetical protein